VRVLFGCSLGGDGHLIPLVNVARAVERAGHEALVLVPPALAQSGADGLPYRVGDEPPRSGHWRRGFRRLAAEIAAMPDRDDVVAGFVGRLPVCEPAD
jgi:hypothetical protein